LLCSFFSGVFGIFPLFHIFGFEDFPVNGEYFPPFTLFAFHPSELGGKNWLPAYLWSGKPFGPYFYAGLFRFLFGGGPLFWWPLVFFLALLSLHVSSQGWAAAASLGLVGADPKEFPLCFRPCPEKKTSSLLIAPFCVFLSWGIMPSLFCSSPEDYNTWPLSDMSPLVSCPPFESLAYLPWSREVGVVVFLFRMISPNREPLQTYSYGFLWSFP